MKTEEITRQSKKINSISWLIGLSAIAFMTLALCMVSPKDKTQKDKSLQLHSTDGPPCLSVEEEINKNCQSKTDKCDYWRAALVQCMQKAERWKAMPDDERRAIRKEQESERRQEK